ncbi:MAG: lysophospholipid acyltransferase family protein [Candidatus Cloacimonetes bacterium]|nr:1-acyl-sn-glycerol-3-phosphate acyltransferase [Candidatus Cloacimonadota bacterium]MCB5255270.1 1-acyl-sn-glycerol-3-phosphate acyltransferase [Candidatus Cloacimonadota bacterium]MCK9177978.1 1-acyl-sn-glycerol-3-phosphate acyltransferase [Candidatus Cloacimonadota bacterium]MCK9243124.1 1-acyl-sn-glycerol-3-phosphate acyltransferase [Candidatus Cloacimonadota bacterium]MDD3104362.1 lysophospholipid acyltransferase family protein [Candidatus Cloacimonadota bacterium]
MNRIRVFLHHFSLLSSFFITGWWIVLSTKDPTLKRQRQVRHNNHLCKKLLKAFGIKLKVNHPERLAALKDSAYLMVSNHVSYTDIIVLASIEELVFITSVEMGNNPFLGSVTRLGGSLYTNRKQPVSLKKEIENFSRAIRQGFKVLLFPEATSTDGSTVREFKRSLFQIALDANCTILPVCIKYLTIDGQKIDDSNRDLVAWYGDMEFVPHFMKLLGRKIEAEITILESIVQPEEKTRAELCMAVYSQIHDCYHDSRKIV